MKRERKKILISNENGKNIQFGHLHPFELWLWRGRQNDIDRDKDGRGQQIRTEIRMAEDSKCGQRE